MPRHIHLYISPSTGVAYRPCPILHELNKEQTRDTVTKSIAMVNHPVSGNDSATIIQGNRIIGERTTKSTTLVDGSNQRQSLEMLEQCELEASKSDLAKTPCWACPVFGSSRISALRVFQRRVLLVPQKTRDVVKRSNTFQNTQHSVRNCQAFARPGSLSTSRT